MELNYKRLNEQLCRMDARAALVDYIFKVQGGGLRRLDYKAAAGSLGVSEHTIFRYVGELAKRRIIVIIGKEIKINEDLITVI